MKKLRAIELKRIKKVLDTLRGYEAVFNVPYPVCEKAHRMREFSCSHPTIGFEMYQCPVRSRCESFMIHTSDVVDAIQLALLKLYGMQIMLEKMQSCKHEWTADPDSGRNICTKCEAFETA